MNRLERLSNPNKFYGYVAGTFQELDIEQRAISIFKYSDGLPLIKIHQQVKPLKRKHYEILDTMPGGDAPKDFIRLYEYEKGKRRANKKQNWDKYIAKVGHKWYPLESITEYLLNRIGEVLGLNIAASQLRLIHNQIRFLSKYFLQEGDNLVHGAQIYSAYLSGDKKFVDEIEASNLSRTLLSFQFTDEAVKFVFPTHHQTIMTELVRLLLFDAITGNNDRHFYNWAVITTITGEKEPRFSPIYDSARGLFWNKPEKVISHKFYEEKKGRKRIDELRLQKYIESSRPKIGWEGWDKTKEINHFELLRLIYGKYPQYQNTCEELLKPLYLWRINQLLTEEFKQFYSTQRFCLIKKCLKRRFEYLIKICKT